MNTKADVSACITCGQPLAQKPGSGRPKLYCRRQCWPKPEPRARPKCHCGSLLRRDNQSGLCMKCKQQGYQWKPIQTRACRSCREEFSSRISSQVYCSPKCRPSTGGIHAANSTDRGYGSAHKRARLEWQAKVEAGVDCCLCGQPINPSESWHLDHTEDRTGYRGAAHPKCNLRDGQRGSALTTLAKHYDVDRDALIAWLSGQGRVGSLAA